MPATVTLPTTTLTSALGASGGRVGVASTDGIIPGMRLYVNGELMSTVSVNGDVQVIRGVDGTAAGPHPSGATVYIGRADQFYQGPPVGIPQAVIAVSPYIDTLSGQIWFAQGDASSAGTANRWWQPQTQTHGGVVLGSRSSTLDPTSST